MNRCVDSSPADSLGLVIVNDVQSELARLSEDSIRNAEVRKRRVDEDDHSFGGPEPVQAGSSPDEVVKTLDNLFSITTATVPVVSSLKSSKEKASEIPFHNSSAAAAQILEYKRLQQAHSQASSTQI